MSAPPKVNAEPLTNQDSPRGAEDVPRTASVSPKTGTGKGERASTPEDGAAPPGKPASFWNENFWGSRKT